MRPGAPALTPSSPRRLEGDARPDRRFCVSKHKWHKTPSLFLLQFFPAKSTGFDTEKSRGVRAIFKI
ncbi:hypothetical protein TURU_167445 [Turdus rufiventris]|nr:hypothetical protein TURU_167445 [Turdus rufiventris]